MSRFNLPACLRPFISGPGSVTNTLLWCVAVAVLFAGTCAVTRAQDTVPPAGGGDTSAATPNAPATDQPAGDSPQKELPLDIGAQAQISRFDRFEKELMQMAEQLRRQDPERADLLFRAHSRSQEERITGQMRSIMELLGGSPPNYGDSVQQQQALLASLKTLLEVLQSENRLNDIEAERERVKELLKNVNRLIGGEKDARAATERGGNLDRAADRQGNVADEAQKLVDKIKQQDAEKQAQEDSQRGSSKKPGEQGEGSDKPSDDSKPEDGEQKQGDQKPGDQKPGEGEQKPQDGQPSDPQQGQPQDGQPQQGQPQQGQPQQGQPQDGQPQQNEPKNLQTPGRDQLEQARDEMQRAIDELRREKDRDKASRHQDEAIRKLLEAKDKLEEILRQLREEEKSLLLASLESRFRKMLGMQLLIYQDTVRLDADKTVDAASKAARARQLARQQEEIIKEAGKALVLMQEEGSSVAFPQAVEAIHEDMNTIAGLLEDARTDDLTQTVEQNVIEALEELIDALQKEIEKQKEEQQQQQQEQQQGEPEDDPLVDALSELKMLRSLQLRINRQTRQIGRLIEGDQADEPEVIGQLQTLSRRQARIQKATYDLATGRNR